MKLNEIIFGLIFFSLAFSSSGQITKFKSTGYATKFKNEYTGKWGEWSEFEKTEVLITVDVKNDRIKIFSKKEQIYDIIKYYEKTTDTDGDETLQFHCVNEDGLKCFVRFVVLNSQNGRRQLYVDFADMMWVYNIYKLD